MGAFQRWTEWNDRTSSWMWRVLWRYGAPLFALAILPFALMDVGPAYRARLGGGTRGVFVTTDRDCGRACTSSGYWVSDDGSRRRDDVLLATGAGSPYPGEQVAAVDTGDRATVYPAGGGWDFLIVTAFLVGSVVLLVVWGADLRARRRNPRAS